jgi:hypothetical protein
VPHLTAFGERFLANGYRIPGVTPRGTFPVAVRSEYAYSSSGGSDESAQQLPRTIVDEIEILTGGSLGPRTSYWAEQYLVDGGFPGRTRDVWLAQRLSADGAAIPVLVRGGQFTLPLPLDPETFRETTDHYAIWGQTAGLNPFAFFDPKIGVQFEIGDAARGLGATIGAFQGHDPQSGLPSTGVDTMVTLAHEIGDVRLDAYRYDGSRSLAGYGFNNTQFFSGINDRFWRNGVGVGFRRGSTEVNAVYQIGNDTAADVYGDALVTSGGFVQVREALGDRTFAIARWDATEGATFARSIIGGLGYRPARNMRLTLFDTAARNPDTNAVHHTVSASLLVAY